MPTPLAADSEDTAVAVLDSCRFLSRIVMNQRAVKVA